MDQDYLSKKSNRTDIIVKDAIQLRDVRIFSAYTLTGIDIDHFAFDRYPSNDLIWAGFNTLLSQVRTNNNIIIVSLPNSSTIRSPICPCGIDRRDCTYHK
jgi:hypothetical protein